MSDIRIEIIPQAKMLEHAGASVLRVSYAKLPGLENWGSATITKTPQVIYDVNGSPLFYDFTVRRGSAVYGIARMAASKLLGTPAVAYELGARSWSLEKAAKSIKPQLMKTFPRCKIVSAKLVCYSYPKIGVKFEIITSRKENVSLLYDVSDFTLIPQIPLIPGTEGSGIWSVYDSISADAAKGKIETYNHIEGANQSIIDRAVSKNLSMASVSKVVSVIDWSKIKLELNIKKELSFCSHYNYNESRSHTCFVLHAQQKNDYCAVATCQMILCYYRYYFSQDTIAPSLGYSPGGCPSDQSAGYENLSNHHINATYDTTPTWEEARNQIDALHPLKSGISGHARACAGYSYTRWLFSNSITSKKLLIYDPWPWNSDYKAGGTVYWENWDSISHTNYIFTKLDY